VGTVRLELVVTPGARTSEVAGPYGEAWKVRITAAPERGRANEAVLDLLADVLGVPRSALALVSGHGGRRKSVAVAGLTAAEAEERLAHASPAKRCG
jgi:uncharacterized protein YggU (UPF0235/DUF167 family)